MENKIKSAEELIEFGYDTYSCWEDLSKNEMYITVKDAIKLAKEYAAQMIEAQLEIAAEEAKVLVTFKDNSSLESSGWGDGEDGNICPSKESIRNCTRIKLD